MTLWSDKAPLERQMTGLDMLWDRVTGATIADIGCAEGDIGMECVRRGAGFVLGIEYRPEAVKEANERARNVDNFTCLREDADHWPGRPMLDRSRFDVILLLAVLHKLHRPAAALDRILRHTAKPTATVVLRLRPRDWPVLRDERSGNRPQDLDEVLRMHRFRLVHVDEGPVSGGVPEWVGLFERVGLG